MDSRRLRHFLAVFEHGSLGRAAEVLNLTQPALSKSVHQLEEELGVKLFDRTPFGVVPTVYGKTLSHHAKIIQSEMHHAEREIASLTGATKGEIVVGVGPGAAVGLMPAAALRLQQERPNVQITVIEGLADDHIPALRRGEIDLAVGNWPSVTDPNLTCEVLARDKVVVVAGSKHPLADMDVQIAQLLEYPWALPSRSQIWRECLDQHFTAKGLTPPVPRMIAANAAGFLRALILQSDYLTLLPRHLISFEERAGLVSLIDIEEIAIDVEISVTYRDRPSMSPACQLLVRALGEICGR